MVGPGPRSKQPDSLGRQIVDDLRQGEWTRGYAQELRDLYRFFLDDDARTRLATMGRIQRSIYLIGWLLKSLYLKLSRPRRLALLIAMLLAIMGQTGFEARAGQYWSINLAAWGFAIVLVVLMLELKDKLVARDEIQIAREVQMALLPREHPELPGWSVWSYSRPANDVGGDLVDYVELDGFRHGVLLGDVAGKGLGASLLCAKLQATIRALVPNADSLEELATQINDIFYRDGIPNRYATLFYAEIEYNSGLCRWVNAGHNPAFVIRVNGFESLESSSFPVGMMDHTSYKEGMLTLEPGDMLVAYSDGLTEVENGAGEEFGPDRVSDLLTTLRTLPPAAIGARVLQEVDVFLGDDGRITDDLSLIVVTRN